MSDHASAADLSSWNPSVEDVLQDASLELDRLGLKAGQLQSVLAGHLEALSVELRAEGERDLQGLEMIAARLHALAGMVGLLRPDLGPRGGVEEALAAAGLTRNAP